MKRILGFIGLVMIATFASVGLTPGDASAATFCYAFSPSFTSERLRLDINFHSVLGTTPATQYVYSVHGKHVGTCGANTMVPVTGTVVVGFTGPNTTQTGAHLGVRTNTVRAGCQALTVECTTTQKVAAPTSWSCNLRQDISSAAPTAVTLTRLAGTGNADALCRIFEDSPPLAPEADSAPASGQSQ